MLRCRTLFSSLLFVVSIFACGEAPDITVATVNATGGLRMRAEPNTSAKRITTIPDGSSVQVLSISGEEIELAGKRGKWSEVQYNEHVGWVFGGFLGSPKPETKDVGGCESLTVDSSRDEFAGKDYKVDIFEFSLRQNGEATVSLYDAMTEGVFDGSWSHEPRRGIHIEFSANLSASCLDGCAEAATAPAEADDCTNSCETKWADPVNAEAFIYSSDSDQFVALMPGSNDERWFYKFDERPVDCIDRD